MAECLGNKKDHCCYLNGKVCQFLEENTVKNRRWVCKLRRELGSWEKVYEDHRYINFVTPLLKLTNYPNVRCGDWPIKNMICVICGVNG